MGTTGVESSLTAPAIERRVAASTQDLAMAALPFLDRHISGKPLDSIDASRAKRQKRLSVVPSRDEVRAVLLNIPGSSCPPVIPARRASFGVCAVFRSAPTDSSGTRGPSLLQARSA